MKKSVAGLCALAVAGFTAPVCAQRAERPVSLEIRAGAAFPIQSFGRAYGDVDVESGYGASGSVTFHHSTAIWFYGGYSYTRLRVAPGTDPAAYRGEDTAVDQGFDAGVRLKLFTSPIPVEPYLRFGGVYHKLTLLGADVGSDGPAAPALPESSFSLGFSAALGGEVRVSPRVSLSTELLLTSYQPRYGGRADATLQMEHVRGDVGMRVRL